LLLENRFAPITYRYGFLRCDFETLRREIKPWKSSLGTWVNESRGAGHLSDALSRLNLLTTPMTREVIIKTSSEWIAYFDNTIQCGDPEPFVGYFAERLGCDGLTVCCCPHTVRNGLPGGTYGATGFAWFVGEQTEWLNVKRSVLVLEDGGVWKFLESGSPLPFERIEKYNNRRIRDRLSVDDVAFYAEQFGIPIFDDSFFTGPFSTYTNLSAMLWKVRSLRLAERRQELALHRLYETPSGE
jgi:hypothetical protein